MMTKVKKTKGDFVGEVYWLIASLVVAHWLVVWLNPSWGWWLDLDREHNVPTAVNALLLGINGLISLFLASKARHKMQKVGWMAFAILFIYFGFDEMFILHEQLAEPVRNALNIASGPLYHAWVIPGLVIATALGGLVWAIRRYYKQLRVFSDILLLVVIMAVVVIALEITGSLVYDNTALYRYVMIPLEEGSEMIITAVILQRLITHTKDKNQNGTRKKTA